MNTEIIVVMDESGSMAALRDDTIGSFNKFLADQRAEPGEARLTVVKFATGVKTLYRGVDLPKVPQMSRSQYKPDGWTALYDGLGYALEVEGHRIFREQWAQGVIVFVVTDGEENYSKKFTGARIQEMVKHAEKHGWKFVYAAANVDAFTTGAAMGFARSMSVNTQNSSTGTHAAYGAMSNVAKKYRSHGASGQSVGSFSADMTQELAETTAKVQP